MIEEFFKSEKNLIDAIIEEYFDELIKQEKEIFFSDFTQQLKEFITNKKAKRIHPVLLIAAFSGIVNPLYLEEQIDQIRKISICVELLHSGHLIQDDLIDDDESRRGSPTFHKQLRNEIEQIYKTQNIDKKEHIIDSYGRDLSILGGNFGFNLGLDVLKISKFPEPIKLLAINEYTEALNYLIKGQIIEEYMEHHNITMTLEQYLNIAELQRARVFEKATRIGAILARGNMHYQVEPLSEAMLRIGQAYAIRDDILDLENDIIGQKKKFIYILAVQNTDEEQSKILNEMFRKTPPLNKEDVNKVADVFTQTNALIIAEQFAKNLIEQAKNYLKDIYPDLNKKQKTFFNEFSDYIYFREF